MFDITDPSSSQHVQTGEKWLAWDPDLPCPLLSPVKEFGNSLVRRNKGSSVVQCFNVEVRFPFRGFLTHQILAPTLCLVSKMSRRDPVALDTHFTSIAGSSVAWCTVRMSIATWLLPRYAYLKRHGSVTALVLTSDVPLLPGYALVVLVATCLCCLDTRCARLRSGWRRYRRRCSSRCDASRRSSTRPETTPSSTTTATPSCTAATSRSD